MEIFFDKFKSLHGYEEGPVNSVDALSSAKAINYKKSVTKNYISLNSGQIDMRLGGTKFYVTRKYDGELTILFYENGEIVSINRSGRVRRNLPCIVEAGKLLAKSGISQAVIATELFVDEEQGRSRVFDVLASLADEKRISNLHLAAFDIIELENQIFKATSYEQTHDKLMSFFGKGELCHPVRMEKAASKKEVKDIYSRWVEGEGAEGLVVRCELPFVFKIKPRYTVDVVVVGFSEGTGDQKGQIRSLLLAMMPGENQYQIIGRTGNGFSDEFKKELLVKYTSEIIGSKYIETDSNHVAFHMVKPETVIELNVNDVLFETTSGPIFNQVLEIIDGQYILHSTVQGVSFVYPIFERFRDDKTANIDDVRLSQINEFSYIEDTTAEKTIELSKSELLHREVYKKESGSKIMVQKFLVWKTNKEQLPEYPAYVFHYTNFSTDRKEPLQREVCISDDYDQILQIQNASIEKNIKKGWVKV